MIIRLLISLLCFLGCTSSYLSQILSEHQEITYLNGEYLSVKKENSRMIYILASAKPHYIAVNSEPYGTYSKMFDMYHNGFNSDGYKIYYCKDNDTGMEVNFVIHEDEVIPYIEKIIVKENNTVFKIMRYYYED